LLNIGKLVWGREQYYLESVARSQREYYTGSREAPGYWLGSGAAALGLGGEVSDDGFMRMLAGAHPDTAARLAEPAAGRRVTGFDLTFRAPKSVSLLYGFGDAAVIRSVREAHEGAVEQAIGYLERHAAIARRGAGGARLVSCEGFVAAAFAHRTSRAGDPLLHTHVVVGNLTRGPDGRWTALDGRALYVHGKTAGYVYQAALRQELTRSLGVAWTPVRNGTAELEGVSRRLVVAFSKRRVQIQQRMETLGTWSARSAQASALETRAAKAKDQNQGQDQQVDEVGLRERWRQEAVALGFDPGAVGGVVGRTDRRAGSLVDRVGDQEELFGRLAGPDGLTRQVSVFSRRDVVQAVCD